MFDRIIRLSIVGAVAVALIASFATRAHSAELAPADCPKPQVPSIKHRHHKHPVLPKAPLESCIAPLPVLLSWGYEPVVLPQVVTRYLDVPGAPYIPPAIVYTPDPWISAPESGFMTFGSYSGGGRVTNSNRYLTVNYSTANTWINQTTVNVSTVTNTLYATVYDTVNNAITTNITINHAPPGGRCKAAPEIDGGNAVGGLTLLAGLLAVARGRRHG